MIIVMSNAQIKKDKLELALALSREHVLRSSAVPGCLSNCVQRDVENPFGIYTVAQWSDRQALLAHLSTPESQDFVQAILAIAISDPELKIYEAYELAVKDLAS
jgi:quinol monooxygenase YgiN